MPLSVVARARRAAPGAARIGHAPKRAENAKRPARSSGPLCALSSAAALAPPFERRGPRQQQRAADVRRKKKKARSIRAGLQNPGSVLLSHRVAPAVPSALKSLTSVFGMGTGVTSSE
jgi:hypothetical protein